MRSFAVASLLVLASCDLPATTTCLASPEQLTPGTHECSLPGWGGRDYLLHIPARYDANVPTPLVLSLHGFTQTRHLHDAMTCPDGHLQDPGCLRGVADEETFILVMPDGQTFPRRWNSSPDSGGQDDVAYIKDLLGALKGALNVDPNRIHATGLSNGGGMSHRLACDMADTIASIVSFGAGNQMGAACKPSRPVAVMDVHGDQDPIWPMEGSTSSGPTVVSSEQESLEGSEEVPGWARINGCMLDRMKDSLPDLDGDGLDVGREVFPGCRANADVVLLIPHGAGHTWPGGQQYAPESVVGKVNRDFNANRVLWDFLKAHPKR